MSASTSGTGDHGYDVLVIAGAGVDTIVRVDSLALPEGDSVFVPPVLDYAGHTGNGVALGCHALGLATKFVDFLGEDVQGRMVLEAYAERGLDFSLFLRGALGVHAREESRLSAPPCAAVQ